MDYDLVIVGGGPAGLAAAIYAGRAEMKTVVLERMMIGGQVAQTMDIANYPGFPETIDGPTLADRMKVQAEKFGATFTVADATAVTKEGDMFAVALSNDTLRAKTVILATGADPRKLGVPGEDELRGKGVSYCGTCDAPFFRDKRIVVVGGGDTALKESLPLAKFASHLTLAHRRDALRGEKIYQRQVINHERITVRWNSIVTRIHGETRVEAVTFKDTKTGEEAQFDTDGVFLFVGTTPNTGLVRGLLPDSDGSHVATDRDMMTAVPGLFAVGDVREHSYRQVATAVGEGATAAMAAEHYLSNQE